MTAIRRQYRGAMSLEVTSSVVGGRPVIALAGTVDLATVPSLHNALTAAILDSPQSTIAVDLGGVESLDDVALGVLLGAAGQATRRRRPRHHHRRRGPASAPRPHHFDRAISVSASLPQT